MSRSSAAQRVAAAGLMIAVIEVCKIMMQALPNIELTSFLLILFTLHFGTLTLFAVPAFILIEGLIYGFGMWWVMYLYAWPLLVCFVRTFSRVDSAFFWAVVSGIFGLLFGALCAAPYFFVGLIGGGVPQGLTQMFSWWVAGIPFDLIHGASNFAIMLALYRPVSALFASLSRIIR